MRTYNKKFSTNELTLAGQALFGDRWQTDLSRALVFRGLFASLDIALAQERKAIHTGIESPEIMLPPPQIFPRSKMFALIAVMIAVLSTMIVLLMILRDLNWLAQQPADVRDFSGAIKSVFIEILLEMVLLLAFTMNLIYSVARNLRTLFNLEISALESVSSGDLSVQVPVTTQDELGYIAGVTNIMITRLRDHLRLRPKYSKIFYPNQHLKLLVWIWPERAGSAKRPVEISMILFR